MSINIVDILIGDKPKLHTVTGDKGLWDFHSNTNLLKDLDKILDNSLQTLEIGAGWSTVVFANSKSQHTCITQAHQETELIKNYCQQKNIDTSKINFIVGNSDIVLPQLPVNQKFDIILIDGSHSFPIPFIDWFYTSKHLKPNGIMIIDDADIKSCNILLQFLESDTDWKIKIRNQNYAFFIKQTDIPPQNWWRNQNFSKIKVGLLGSAENIKFKLGRILKRK